ncbi:MAG: beta-carotene hydroxylase, partial [Chitinophagales bacterium]
HKTHHLPGKSIFEWNDLFSLFFGGIAVWLIFSGLKESDNRFWAGVGIASYGILYFILHDVMIHGRMRLMRYSGNRYIRALIRAHKVHHKQLERVGSESFGLLWVSKKYFN